MARKNLSNPIGNGSGLCLCSDRKGVQKVINLLTAFVESVSQEEAFGVVL